MVYFKITDLIGRHNTQFTYQSFIVLEQWLNVNLPPDVWVLDYSNPVYVQGYTLPGSLSIQCWPSAFKFGEAFFG